MANKYNVHTQFYTNKKVVPGPEGILTGKNHNIQRGGGYGFNAKGTPGFGVMPIQSYSNCGTGKTPPVSHATGAIGTQHVGSPPPQRGGGKGTATNINVASICLSALCNSQMYVSTLISTLAL